MHHSYTQNSYSQIQRALKRFWRLIVAQSVYWDTWCVFLITGKTEKVHVVELCFSVLLFTLTFKAMMTVHAKNQVKEKTLFAWKKISLFQLWFITKVTHKGSRRHNGQFAFGLINKNEGTYIIFRNSHDAMQSIIQSLGVFFSLVFSSDIRGFPNLWGDIRELRTRNHQVASFLPNITTGVC